MECRLLLAVRPLAEGKSRLSTAISDADRQFINSNMLEHVLSVVHEIFPATAVSLISRSNELLNTTRARGMTGIREHGDNLNAALTQGAEAARQVGAPALLALSSDLPFLTADDLRAMLERPEAVVIATDRARQGTNALLLRPPLAIPYRYGTDSLARHLAEAEKAGLTASVVERAGLARDIDTPADLAEWRKA